MEFDPIELPSTTTLVRLRIFLEDAERRATDSSEPGRHLAIVALDGAVEYALWLAAHATNAPLRPRTDFHRLIEIVGARLAELGRDWEPRGRAQTLQLHTARNAAQHEAIAHDAHQVRDWTLAARAFIESLIEAAFERKVGDILLSDSIHHPGARSLLADAERALTREDYVGAFRAAWSAFDIARKEWREQHGAHSPSRPPTEGQLWPRGGAGRDPRVEPIGDLLEAAAFANDIGEFVSLRAAYNQHVSGWPPAYEDAARAISFASSWIARWEVFSRGYPAERFASHWNQIEPPTHGDGRTPEILACDVSVASSSATEQQIHVVEAQLANLPERGRGDWGEDMPKAWHDAVRECGSEVSTIGVRTVLPAGRLTIYLEPGSPGEDVVAALRRAVTLADECYAKRSVERDRTERERTRLAQRVREALDADRDELFEVQVENQIRGSGERMIAAIAIAGGGLPELTLAVELMRGLGGPLASAGLFDGRIQLDLTDAADGVLVSLREAASLIRREVASSRKRRGEQLHDYRAFAAALEQAFPARAEERS